ncbi:MAG: hypothetical protein LBV19_01990 [Streptococcaceae bacterium]|jgi:hypothetical protein|nr:hypothetical protein [Streptococcaceae bacterium]
MHEKVQAEPKRRKRKKLFLLLGLLVLLIVACSIWLVLTYNSGKKIVSGLPETKATQKMTAGQLKKYADKVVDQNNVTIQVYPNVTIDSDGVTGKMWIQNPPVNATGQEASLMTEKGELLYDSGLIEPGYQVSDVKLTKKLAKGKHSGVIAVNFYDLKNKKQVGQTKVDVSITVN